VRGADILIFCAPHQFIRSMCKQLIGKIKPDAFAISLIKVSLMVLVLWLHGRQGMFELAAPALASCSKAAAASSKVCWQQQQQSEPPPTSAI
jgi:hypothetical protein